MFAAIIPLLTSRFALYGLLCALLVGAVYWFADDYAYQRRMADEREAQVEALLLADAEKDATHALEVEQLRASALAAERVAERRAVEAADLAADLEAIRGAPDDACPVHPAIRLALDLLRQRP